MTALHPVSLGAKGVSLALELLTDSDLSKFVSGGNLEPCDAWIYLPEGIESKDLPDPHWGLWNELPTKITQGIINRSARAVENIVAEIGASLVDPCMVFADPLRKSATLELCDGTVLSPIAETPPFGKYYMLGGNLLTPGNVGVLIDYCDAIFAGGGLLGSCATSSTTMIPTIKEVRELIQSPCAFVCGAYDGEATIIVSMDCAKVNLDVLKAYVRVSGPQAMSIRPTRRKAT